MYDIFSTKLFVYAAWQIYPFDRKVEYIYNKVAIFSYFLEVTLLAYSSSEGGIHTQEGMKSTE